MQDSLKTWRFATFEPDRVPYYVIEYVLISKFVRYVTLKCQTENVLEQGKRWVIAQVLAN